MKTYSTNEIISFLSQGRLIEEIMKGLETVNANEEKETLKGTLIFDNKEENYHFVTKKDGTYGLPHFNPHRKK